jgi:hypothetical protein
LDCVARQDEPVSGDTATAGISGILAPKRQENRRRNSEYHRRSCRRQTVGGSIAAGNDMSITDNLRQKQQE